MGNRISLQQKLESILGTRNVYYNPPENLAMKYPAIRYRLVGSSNAKANDSNYIKHRKYELTLIDYDADSQYVDLLEELPYCELNSPYTADGLYHFKFTLFF